jgi:type VI secretion system secreted protein VgrG
MMQRVNLMTAKRSYVYAGLALLVFLASVNAATAQVAPPLGTAQQFAVLGNSAVTGATGTGAVVNGDVGSSPNATISNFPPSTATAPFIVHSTNDNVVQSAHADAVVAYNNMVAQGSGTVIADNLGVAGALGPGIYSFVTGAADLPAGATLTLNGNGIFIFNVASSLTMNVNSNIAGTASPCNIYWRVGSSATLNGTLMRGTVIANASITVGAGSTVVGRVLAGTGPTGAVTMAGNGGNVIGGCSSAAIVPTPPPGSTAASCPNPASIPPSISTMNPQSVATNGQITVFFQVSGSQIPNALQVTASSSELAVVPLAGLTVIHPDVSGQMSVRITPATGATGSTIISVTVRDPNTQCASVASFVLSVGAAAVPTLAQWAVLSLALLLMFAGYQALQRRPIAI